MVLLVAGVVAVGTLALASTPSLAPSQGAMGFWEAYARGFVSVVMENEAFQENGVPVELPVGIRVTSMASVPVAISEEAVLMSPHPSPSPPPDPADTTADAVLTNGTIPAHGSLLYLFGEYVLAGWLSGPTWWDLEEMQYSKAGVAFAVGGETLPFALRSLIEHPFYRGPDDNTQITLYAYLRSHPVVVVGKLPLWATTGGAAGATVRVRLDATNLAVWAKDDTETQNVNVTNGILQDEVPVGWSVEEGSYPVPPDLVVNHAETLAVVCMLEAHEPGAPAIYGSVLSGMDPKTGAYMGSSPESDLLAIGSIEMAKYLGLPDSVGGYGSTAKVPGVQASLEHMLSAVVCANYGGEVVNGLGEPAGSTLLSYEQILLDHEIAAMIVKVYQGFRVDTEELAVDLIEKVGIGGSYLAQRHTLERMRDISVPMLWDTSPYDHWVAGGKKDPMEVAREKTDWILKNHAPEPLPRETVQNLDGIVHKLGMG